MHHCVKITNLFMSSIKLSHFKRKVDTLDYTPHTKTFQKGHIYIHMVFLRKGLGIS